MLSETAVLAFIGGMLGLLLAAAASVGLRSAAVNLPRMDEITLDWRILLYTLITVMTATLLCGALPAIRTGREDAARALKEAGLYAGLTSKCPAVAARRSASGAVGHVARGRRPAGPQLS